MFNKFFGEFDKFLCITVIYIYSKQLVMIVITDLVNTDCEFTMSHHVILKQPLIVKSLKWMYAVFLFWLTGILRHFNPELRCFFYNNVFICRKHIMLHHFMLQQRETETP